MCMKCIEVVLTWKHLNVVQVFAIVGNWDHAVIPIAWVLMQRRTAAAYESVLRVFRLLLRGAPNLQRVITDFENAQRIGWLSSFDWIILQGCFFHLVRVSLLRPIYLGADFMNAVQMLLIIYLCFSGLYQVCKRAVRLAGVSS